MPRRERSAIVGEMLEALSQAGASGETRLTVVAAKCNLPYDRFQEYLKDLQARGLVELRDPLRLTPQGRELLHVFRSWRDRLRLFGLGP